MGTLISLLVLTMGFGQLEPLEEPLQELEFLPLGREEALKPLAQSKYAPGTVLFVDATSLALRTGRSDW